MAELREKVKQSKALDNMGGMMKRVFESKDNASRQDAHKRLKAVMLQDRTTMTAEALMDLRNHIILLLANYVPVDRRRLEMDIKQSGESLALTANVRVDLEPQEYNIVENGDSTDREWLLSPKRSAALRRDLLDTVGSYMPIFPDSAEVREEHFSTYVMVYTGLRIADGVGFDEKARQEMAVSFRSGDF